MLEPVDEKFKLFEFVAFGFITVVTASAFGVSEGSGRGDRPCATYTPGSAVAGM